MDIEFLSSTLKSPNQIWAKELPLILVSSRGVKITFFSLIFSKSCSSVYEGKSYYAVWNVVASLSANKIWCHVCGGMSLASSDFVNFHHFTSSHISSRSSAFNFLHSCQSDINQTWRFLYHSQIFAVIKSRVLTCFQIVTQIHRKEQQTNRVSLVCIWADGYQNICNEKIIRSQFFLLSMSLLACPMSNPSHMIFLSSVRCPFTALEMEHLNGFAFMCNCHSFCSGCNIILHSVIFSESVFHSILFHLLLVYGKIEEFSKLDKTCNNDQETNKICIGHSRRNLQTIAIISHKMKYFNQNVIGIHQPLMVLLLRFTANLVLFLSFHNWKKNARKNFIVVGVQYSLRYDMNDKIRSWLVNAVCLVFPHFEACLCASECVQ